MFLIPPILFLEALCLLSLGSLIWSRRYSKRRKLLLLIATAVGLTVASMLPSINESPRYSPTAIPQSDSRELHRGRKAVSRLEAAIDALPIGQVLFNHPTEMELRKPDSVKVRISQSLLEDLSHDLKKGGTTKRNQIPVSASMRVEVSGDPYFNVTPLSEEEQLITRKGFSEWSFTVIPQKAGTWPLHLRVSAVIHTPWGSDKFKSYPVKDEDVRVRVTVIGAVGNFLSDNWQWLWTTVLIPVAILVWKKIRSNREKKEQPPPSIESKAA
jgi:hypothetical protein